MRRTQKQWAILGQLVKIGINPTDEQETALQAIRRLSRKHHRQCENQCNGEGVVKGWFRRCDSPNGYVREDYSYFDQEIDRLEEKMKTIAGKNDIDIEFQGDPRGYTVRVKINGVDISQMLWN